MEKRERKNEFNPRFVIDQLEQYQQEWFKRLMEQKIERLHCTIKPKDNLKVFHYTYNVYLHEDVYQVIVTPNEVELARHLYKKVKVTKNNTIQYQSVREQQIVKDRSIIKQISNIIKQELNTLN